MVTATKPHRGSSARRSNKEITSAVRPVAETLATRSDLVLWGVTFVKVAGRDTLRVSLDRLGGIDADELARYSESLSRELDRTDAIPGDQSYMLEISSPGAERKLETPEQFAVCIDREAKVTLNDGRTVEGKITSVTDDTVAVEGSAPVRFSEIAKARLVVKF
jgi:ribosome maturation factor RimP